MKSKQTKECHNNIHPSAKDLLKQTDDLGTSAIMMCDYFMHITAPQTKEQMQDSLILSMVYLYYSVLSRDMNMTELSEKMKNTCDNLLERLIEKGLI